MLARLLGTCTSQFWRAMLRIQPEILLCFVILELVVFKRNHLNVMLWLFFRFSDTRLIVSTLIQLNWVKKQTTKNKKSTKKAFHHCTSDMSHDASGSNVCNVNPSHECEYDNTCVISALHQCEGSRIRRPARQPASQSQPNFKPRC